MTSMPISEIERNIERTRSHMEGTLEQIRDRVDVPARLGETMDHAKLRARYEMRRRARPVLAGAIALGATAGLAAFVQHRRRERNTPINRLRRAVRAGASTARSSGDRVRSRLF